MSNEHIHPVFRAIAEDFNSIITGKPLPSTTVQCPSCYGTGASDTTIVCRMCRGAGRVWTNLENGQ